MSDYMRSRQGEESDSFFCRFTFGQFFAILILEVFTLFFVFYLGARYGREFLGLDRAVLASAESSRDESSSINEATGVLTTSDPGAEKLAKELVAKASTPELKDRIARMFEEAKAASEPKMLPPEAAVQQIPNTNDASPQLSQPAVAADAEQPSLAEGPAAPEPVRQMPESELEAAKVVPGERQTDVTLPPSSSEMGNSVVKVKSVDNARYSVQVGSYPKMDEANRATERWKTKGYPAYVMIANIPDRGQWYRVRIGGFTSRGEAEKYLGEFKTKENAEALVVMNEQ